MTGTEIIGILVAAVVFVVALKVLWWAFKKTMKMAFYAGVLLLVLAAAGTAWWYFG